MMADSFKGDFQFIIPVKNGVGVLEHSLTQLSHFCLSHPGSYITVAENQSSDGTPQVLRRFLAQFPQSPITPLFLQAEGLGAAYRAAIQSVLAQRDDSNFYFVLSAADLPFGFSDVSAFLATKPVPNIAIGSKAHPLSRVLRPFIRTLASKGFYVIRRLLLKMKTRDSQGTVLLSADAARKLIDQIQSNDFFFSTELIFLAERSGMTVVELPVVLRESRHPSTVHLVRDGFRILRHLSRLWIAKVGR